MSLPMPEAAAGGTDRPAVDALALAHHLDRIARAAQPPWLHGEVARRMASRLVVMRDAPATWLDWSAFLGGGADAVAAVYPQARRMVAEPTPALARRSAGPAAAWWSPRRWRGAPEVRAADEVPAGAAALLWANMALHHAPDPQPVFAAWQRAIAVDGFLMFSTLGPGSLRELRELYAEAGWGAPHAPFVDMHDLGDMLVHAGFADPVMDQETLTLTWSSPEAALAELRALGGNAARDRHAGLRTPHWRERLCRALAAKAGPDGRIGLGFEIVYGHAFRPAPKARVAADTRIALEDMRASLRRPRRGDTTP